MVDILGRWVGEECAPGPLDDLLTGHLRSLFRCLFVQLSEYIKSTVHSANAVVGTCKMGAESDEMAVVNSALQVSTCTDIHSLDWNGRRKE